MSVFWRGEKALSTQDDRRLAVTVLSPPCLRKLRNQKGQPGQERFDLYSSFLLNVFL